MTDWKYHAKYLGKLVTYLGLIPASAGMTVSLLSGLDTTSTPFFVGVAGTLLVIIGCTAHEYSE